MKALVIGGTGPTGPHVVEGLLQRGYEVSILHGGFHEVEFSQPVEHIHADAHFTETLEQALGQRTFDVVMAMYGRLRLTAEFMKGKTGRFIGVGGAAYTRRRDPMNNPEGLTLPIPETASQNIDPERDRFSYLMYQSEQTVLQAHQEGHFNATLFRYPNIWGPRQLAAKEWCIIRRVRDKRPHYIIPDGGHKLETWGYVENVAHGLLLAVDKPKEAAGQIYNIADDLMITLKTRIDMITQAMNHNWELVDMPYALARPSYPFWRGPRHGPLDLTKIKTQLGYKDVVPPGEAMQRAVRYYTDNPPEPGGELESQLRDPFDYAAEDEIIRRYKDGIASVNEVPYPEFSYAHPYRHPRQPGEAWTPPRADRRRRR